jgi:hypothetical protein
MRTHVKIGVSIGIRLADIYPCSRGPAYQTRECPLS